MTTERKMVELDERGNSPEPPIILMGGAEGKSAAAPAGNNSIFSGCQILRGKQNQ